MYIKALTIFILFLTTIIQPQSKRSIFSDNFVFSLKGALTLAKTDYRTDKIGLAGWASAEFFHPVSATSIFGIQASFGGKNLKGEDDREIIGESPALESFKTDILFAGTELSYLYSIKDNFFPYISVGYAHLWFSPKDDNGVVAPRNSQDLYKKTTYEFNTGAGLRFRISDMFSGEIGSRLHFVQNDNLDDISTGAKKDFYTSFFAGISISLLGSTDSDDDGIENDRDKCPENAEDIDGFEDSDGCPDPDNDGDGVLDRNDECPENKEDLDSFQDRDGCPDIDNDKDGVPDSEDNCKNSPEDIDSFQDEDGCPEDDNDSDGVPDSLDKCPFSPEGSVVDENGCSDSDQDGVMDDLDKCPGTPRGAAVDSSGCPDKTETGDNTSSAPGEVVLEEETTFQPGTDEILPSAQAELNRIVTLLKLHTEIDWRIEGHSDNRQTDNMVVRSLSLRRAEAILNYFISKGLPSFQFRVYDMGSRFPVANNDTEFGRKKNRRVVIVREK